MYNSNLMVSGVTFENALMKTSKNRLTSGGILWRGVRAISAAIGPLVHTLRHQDVPVLIDGVRLRGLRHELVHSLREYADVAPCVFGDPLQELLVHILVLRNTPNFTTTIRSCTRRLAQKKIRSCRSGEFVRGTGRPARSGPPGSSGSQHLAGIGDNKGAILRDQQISAK